MKDPIDMKNRFPRARWLVIALVCSCLYLLYDLAQYEKVYFVTIIVPDDYRGYIVIKKILGANVNNVDGNNITCLVATDGISTVADDYFLTNWHRLSCKRVRGNAIQCYNYYNDQHLACDDMVCLWSLYSTNKSDHWYFLGTKQQCREANEKNELK